MSIPNRDGLMFELEGIKYNLINQKEDLAKMESDNKIPKECEVLTNNLEKYITSLENIFEIKKIDKNAIKELKNTIYNELEEDRANESLEKCSGIISTKSRLLGLLRQILDYSYNRISNKPKVYRKSRKARKARKTRKMRK
jgi:hypothetical protein